MASRYWSDEAYSQFYARSAAEKRLVNIRPHGSAGSAGGPTKEQLNKFQQTFAEWSSLRGGLRPTDFRPFLLQLGLDLSRAQTASLWRDYVEEATSQYLGYDGALDAYLQVTGGSMRFERSDETKQTPPASAGANAAAATAPSSRVSGGRGTANTAAVAVDVRDVRVSGARCAEGDGAIEGLGMLLTAAREFLLAEGLLAADVETFLRPFARQGAVPQSALFDFLAEQAGAQDEAFPASPSGHFSGEYLTVAA